MKLWNSSFLWIRDQSLLACIAIAFLLSLVSLGYRVPSVSANTDGTALVRIVQASSDIATVSISVDQMITQRSSSFGDVTNYVKVPTGQHQVQVELIGKGESATDMTKTLNVSPGVPYTVATLGTRATGFSFQVFTDNNLVSPDQTKMRMYHLSPNAGPVTISKNAQPLVSGLQYQQASDYLNVSTSSDTFRVTSLTSPQLSELLPPTLKSNMVTSVFAMGLFHGTPPFQLVTRQEAGMVNGPDTGSDPYAFVVQHVREEANQPGMLWLLGSCWLIVLALSLIATRLVAPVSKHMLVLVAMSVILLPEMALGMLLPSKPTFAHSLPMKQSNTLAATHTKTVSPAMSDIQRLLIPTIHVNAPVESLGILANGSLATPIQHPWDGAGWYDIGPQPGEIGSAVIDAHLDQPGGYPATFWYLQDIHVGDSVTVLRAQRPTLTFRVTRIAFYSASAMPAQEVFGNTRGFYLNLITCAGAWIPQQHQTTLRQVVYTTLERKGYS